MGEYEKEIEMFDEALSITWELGDKDPAYKCKVLGVLGRCRAALGQYELAFLRHTEEWNIAQSLDDSESHKMFAAMDLGVILCCQVRVMPRCGTDTWRARRIQVD